ncbi:MAG: HofP DNA utilization family protein [Kluyvera sp.]
MTSLNRAWLLLALPLLVAMRDPFAPVIDPCQAAQLSQWHFRGVVHSGSRMIGLMQGTEGQWRRVETGTLFNAGWRVIEIAADSLTTDTGIGCEPQRWQWKREGTPDDKKELSTHTARSAVTEPGQKRQSDRGRRPGSAGAAKPGRS